ncbi:MAG TPA: P-loop NTPase [Bdellovibrionales bacterium]|nr:P-loop NTPase [Bdellovibrionales bacterium]
MESNTANRAEYSRVRGRLEPGSTIIAVGGGKGGVGKSFVSSSIAIFLSELGYDTLAVDLDLGGANLHTSLGVPLHNKGINEFISNPNLELTDLIQPTHWPKLQLVSGSSEMLGTANIDELSRTRLMSSIFRHKTDYVILDLSAGTHNATLDFFLMAKHKVAVFTPEPSSVENAYRFLKASFFRKLRRYEHQLNLKSAIDDLLDNREANGIKNPADMMKALVERQPVMGLKLKNIMQDMNFGIVLNQARTRQETEMGHALRSVCNKYFGFPCEFLGGLEYDNAVWQSLRQKNHLLMANRQTHLYAQLMTIARKLGKNPPSRNAA